MTHILVCTFCPQLKSHKQVKRGAILGTMNKANENIFNCPVATKQLLFRSHTCKISIQQTKFRLLDLLSAEPRWGEGDVCEECQVRFGAVETCLECLNLMKCELKAKFGLTTRRHHCRHCGRLLCSKCSAKEMPIIKYNLSKQVMAGS